MKRILIDYKKLDHKVAAQLIDLYPDGYGDDDIISIRKPNGELIDAVEVKTSDTIYLVKISRSLSNFIANFEETIEKELDKNLVAAEFEDGSFDDSLESTPEEDMDYDEGY